MHALSCPFQSFFTHHSSLLNNVLSVSLKPSPSLPPSLTHSRRLSLSLCGLDFYSPAPTMGGYGPAFWLSYLGFLLMKVPSIMADCPLDLSGSNFTLAASACSNKDERGKCCRYINAFVALSIARYANVTGSLGVPSNISDICLSSISQTMQLYGVSRNATAFCGFGTKIPVNYECKGRTSVTQMLLSPKFVDVTENCKVPLSVDSKCKKCVNSGITYLHQLLGAAEDNVTLSTCRDATFAALASQMHDGSAVDFASCFFGVKGLNIPPVLESPPLASTPEVSPSPLIAASPNQLMSGSHQNESHHHYHLTLIPGIGIAVTVVALIMLAVLIIIIRQKSKELEDPGNLDENSSEVFHPSRPTRKLQEGPSMFRKFSYKEIKKATDNFNTIIGQGGFGTVYKGQFADGLVAAVKRMNKDSEQAEDEFCREIELVARLHHRHLVSLRGFCIEKHDRFLLYEYMSNGSLKDHLHCPGKIPLSWQIRIQIAIDVANALEYLHFYCDPPLCHRDIKSSNILVDENFVAKVADFGLARASKDGFICLEPVNTDIWGTPGYIDPEYVVTQELTEKSDVYSYGVVLLEIITGRRAIQDSKNLVEWSQKFMEPESDLHEFVDPRIRDSVDLEQLQTVATIVEWCTQKEGRARPSIKQVLRLLYESSDVMHSGFVRAMEDEEYVGSEGRGRASKGKMHRNESVFHSGDGRYLASSSSTSRSHCSRSFLLETGSPQSPPNNILSI